MSLDDELNAFTGTTRYFRHPSGILFTEGVNYLAESAGAYWLIDVVASYQPRVRSERFQLWELTTSPDRTGRVTMRADSQVAATAETYSRVVRVRSSYVAGEVIFNPRFVNIFDETESGGARTDIRRIGEVERVA